MVSPDAVGRPSSQIHIDAILFRQPTFTYLHGYVSLFGEWVRLVFLCDELDAPEESATTDVAHVGVAAETLVQPSGEQRAHCSNIAQKILIPNNALDLECCRADGRVALICVAVDESATLSVSLTDSSWWRVRVTYELPFSNTSTTCRFTSTPATGW